MIRKSNLPQHTTKNRETGGVLNFAAQAKRIVEVNLTSYFLEMISATDLYKTLVDSYIRVSDS